MNLKELKKINRVIDKVVLALETNNIILEEEHDIYCYGLEILMSNLILLTTIFMVGIVTNRSQYTAIFLLIFIGMRRVMGGYHASKRWQCFIITHMLHGLIIGLTMVECTEIMNDLVFICIIFTVSIVYIAAPIENKDNPKTPKELVRNRRVSRIVVSILAISTLAGFYGGNSNYKVLWSTVAVIMSIVGILILVPYIKE